MKYALNLGKDGRVLSATEPKYAPKNAVQVDSLPDGDISEYRYQDDSYIHDPLPTLPKKPSQLEVMEAQLNYTAKMTDTLLEV